MLKGVSEAATETEVGAESERTEEKSGNATVKLQLNDIFSGQ